MFTLQSLNPLIPKVIIKRVSKSTYFHLFFICSSQITCRSHSCFSYYQKTPPASFFLPKDKSCIAQDACEIILLKCTVENEGGFLKLQPLCFSYKVDQVFQVHTIFQPFVIQIYLCQNCEESCSGCT